MHILDRLQQQARQNPQHIVLCEGHDLRILRAAQQAQAANVARITLLGKPDTVQAAARQNGLDLAGIQIIDPAQSGWLDTFAQSLHGLRRYAGLSPEQCLQASADPLTFGMLMLRSGHADGCLAGATYTTAQVASQAIHIVGPQSGRHCVSSFFLMLREEPFYDDEQALLFADCAVVIEPNEQQLADIAIASAHSAELLMQTPARVAMLSFSTAGSASHQRADTVRRATVHVRKRWPGLAIDGEIQADAALSPALAQRKLTHSRIHGRANVLIFPNLDAANIGYKLTEYLGGALAVGPVFQGLNRPCSDLSRGCTATEVFDTIVVTCVMAQARQGQTRADSAQP
jgi:phosphate acetyltransferase